MRIRLHKQRSKYVVGVLLTVGYFGGLALLLRLNVFTNEALVIAIGAAVFFLILLIYQAHTVRVSAQELALQFADDAQLFIDLYEQSPVPYLRTNNRGKILEANAAAVRLFGMPEEQLEGWNVLESIREDGERISVPISSYFTRGTAITEREVVLTLPNGTSRWVLFSAFPFQQNRESLVTLIDITQQKNVDIAKTEFVSLASHQLNTPISSIKWNLELLETIDGENLSPQQHELIAKLGRSTKRMELIIKDFLDASKLEMGSFAAEYREFDMVPFIQELLGEFDARIAQKHIQLQYQTAEEACVITSDDHLLRMSLNNLISNAVKYTPENGVVEITVQCNTETVDVTVSDSGIGIPEAEQSRLFSKFFRADNAKSSPEKGTGLGLYITKKAIDLIGATIGVNSQEGEGTSFTVSIPRRDK